MMRPLIVGNNHTSMKSAADKATAELEQQLQLRNTPNPFNNNLNIQLKLPQEGQLAINVYDAKGARVRQVASNKYSAGWQQFSIDGSSWTAGTYYLEVIVNNQQLLRKLVLQK
ncbi:MAG: T9SS type A sorting domain-containing protein [Chitinophagaceae bacterium]